MAEIRPLSTLDHFFSTYYNIDGDLNNMNPSSLDLVNEAFTLAKILDKSKVIFK